MRVFVALATLPIGRILRKGAVSASDDRAITAFQARAGDADTREQTLTTGLKT